MRGGREKDTVESVGGHVDAHVGVGDLGHSNTLSVSLCNKNNN